MNQPTDLQVILGGVTVTAKLRDGTTEEVKVRQLPIRLLTTKWAQCLNDTAALVELYCDKQKEGWDDLLLPESHDEILKIGEELNLPLFARWSEGQRATVERMQGITTRITADLASKSSLTPAASP